MLSGLRQLAASIPIRTAASGAQIALPILAVQTTGSVALGATLVALALLPSIVAAPLVGVLLDRSRNPRALMTTAALGTAAAYATASALGPLPTPVVAVVLAASGLLVPFGFGGLSSFVARPGTDIRRSYALDALSYNLSGVGGPALVAVLAPTLGPRAALLVMAAVATLSVVGYPLLRMTPRGGPRSGMLRSMGTGLRALVTARGLAVVTSSSTLSELGRGIMPIAAIGIALATTGDAADSARVVAAYAVGALIGTAVETVRHPVAAPPVRMAIGFALTGAATLGAAIEIGLPWTIALVGLSGLFTAAPTAAMLMLRRTLSPEGTVAQVFTVSAALRVGAGAGGTALAGAAAGVSPFLLLAASGAVWLVAAAVMALAYPRR